MKRRYGWKPDLPDARDRRFLTTAPKPLPATADLRAHCSPVDDQGELGSCSAHALAGALEYDAILAGKPLDFSRLFIYYEERKIDGTIASDAGSFIRSGMKACANVGACEERVWPYNISAYRRAPGKRALGNAAKHRIGEYQRVRGLYDLKHALHYGRPVAFGFTVYESFESDAVTASGIVPLPGAHERVLGGHAVLAVGYDDTQSAALVRNSWGPQWGRGGYFWMPYDYIANPDLADDFWLIQPPKEPT